MASATLINSLKIIQGRYCHQVSYEKSFDFQHCLDFRIAEKGCALSCPLAMGTEMDCTYTQQGLEGDKSD